MEDIQVYRWDTFKRTISYTDDNWDPIDITGSTTTFTVKSCEEDPDVDAIIQKDADITDATGGIATLVITATEMADITPDTYVYDLQYKTLAGDVTTLLKWEFKVTYDITQT